MKRAKIKSLKYEIKNEKETGSKSSVLSATTHCFESSCGRKELKLCGRIRATFGVHPFKWMICWKGDLKERSQIERCCILPIIKILCELPEEKAKWEKIKWDYKRYLSPATEISSKDENTIWL